MCGLSETCVVNYLLVGWLVVGRGSWMVLVAPCTLLALRSSPNSSSEP